MKSFVIATNHCILFLGTFTLHVSERPDLLT